VGVVDQVFEVFNVAADTVYHHMLDIVAAVALFKILDGAV